VEVIQLSEETRKRLLVLFAQFPPVAIQTDGHMEAAQEIVDHLVGRERDEAEELYLDLLGTLIYAYELAHVERGPHEDAEVGQSVPRALRAELALEGVVDGLDALFGSSPASRSVGVHRADPVGQGRPSVRGRSPRTPGRRTP
jgi:hypothetical protein